MCKDSVLTNYLFGLGEIWNLPNNECPISSIKNMSAYTEKYLGVNGSDTQKAFLDTLSWWVESGIGRSLGTETDMNFFLSRIALHT